MTDETMRGGTEAEVIATLRAFALNRLSPNDRAVRRMRAAVMREARATLAPTTRRGAAPAPSIAMMPNSRPNGGPRVVALAARRRPHRVATALLAATLAILALAGATFAARPGGALYGVRIWAETVLLPADAGRRVDSELRRLDERLAEVQEAAGAGNQPAAAAALDAYRQIVDEAIAAAGSDTELQARLELVLGKHLAVLEALLGQVPAQAQDAIERAIDNSDKAVDRIGRPGNPGNGGGSPGSGKPSPGPADKPSTGPGAKPTPKPTAKANATAEPSFAPTPSTPAPTPPSTPKATPERPSPPPGDNGGGGDQGSQTGD